MDSASNRHIVKVMSQDRKELPTLLAIPYLNERPSDQPQVRFMKRPLRPVTVPGPTRSRFGSTPEIPRP